MIEVLEKVPVCSFCYACTGRYIFGSVRAKLGRNFQISRLPDFPGKIGALLDELEPEFFRIHDSGDFYNIAYINKWVRIIREHPNVKFWAPTRSHRIPSMIPALQSLVAAGAVIRPSATYIGDPPPVVEGLSAGGMVPETRPQVPKGVWICPASLHHTSCEREKCRRCWTQPEVPVAYIRHGARVSEKQIALMKRKDFEV